MSLVLTPFKFFLLDSEKLYADAMKNGCIERKVLKCLIVGAAGVGKTSIKHLILSKELPKKCVSTGMLENPTHAITISRANMKIDDSWYVVDNDEDLTKMIAMFIKAGVSTLPVAQEKSESAGTTLGLVVDQDLVNSVVHDQDKRKVNSAGMLASKGTTESQKDSICSKVIGAMVEAKGV